MSEPAKFRPDIEGLRAVAVLLVLAFHTNLPVTGGYAGVDVFFVISGFLITGLLLREAEATGRISLMGFYARRVKRLLPAASAVLLTVLGLSWWLAPSVDQAVFAGDVIAAAAYFVNWRFAERAVDYLAEDVGRSPVLHFWSLSVEEQFYFIWPLLIVLALFVARHAKLRLRPTTAVTLSAVLLPSFGWSVLSSHSSQAFFVTTTRLWELSLGALLSLGLPLCQRAPRQLAAPASWLGALAIVVPALALDEKAAWPGAWAALPTVGTALLIFSGTLTPKTHLGRALASRPMVWLGGLSYSLYLWHWPLLVVGQDWLQLTGVAWGSGLVAASLLPAWLSYRFVERPARFSGSLAKHPLGTLSLGANLSLIVVVTGLVLSSQTEPINVGSGDLLLTVQRGQVVLAPEHLGAGALGKRPKDSDAGRPRDTYPSITPAPDGATKDLPRAYLVGCQAGVDEETSKWCEVGDLNASRRVVVLGDSKIMQYYEALDAAGRALGWRIATATKASCASTNSFVVNNGKPYAACNRFNESVLRALHADPPEAIITSQNATQAAAAPGRKSSRSGMIQGLAARWTALSKLGTKVIVLLDNPHPTRGLKVYQCLQEHPNHAQQCAFDRSRGVKRSASGVLEAAASRTPGVRVLDLTDYVCPSSKCAPVIGGVLVYRQGSHITNTYAKTLAPVLTQRLGQLLGD